MARSSSRGRGAEPIQLLLVEDHPQVAVALAAAFSTVADIDLVGTVRTVAECVPAAVRLRPDVVLLDRRLPDGDGIDVIGRMLEQSPASRVLVFTGSADRTVVSRVMAAGGAGVVLKAGPLEDLLRTIRDVAAGHDSFDVELPTRLAGDQ